MAVVRAPTPLFCWSLLYSDSAYARAHSARWRTTTSPRSRTSRASSFST
jgi:hypothetical protein